MFVIDLVQGSATWQVSRRYCLRAPERLRRDHTALRRRYSQFLPLKQTLAKENRGFVETVDFPGKTLLGPPTGEKVTSVNRATPHQLTPRFPPCRS